jgi:AcrR family transcriptional regulator
MARQDRRQREFERREDEILDAALALCSTSQFESITVGQMAERADVGKGTLYSHFASKDELLFRLNLRFYRGLLAELREGLVEGPPAARIRNIIEEALRYHITHCEYRYVVEYCNRIDFRERADPSWREEFLALDRAFEAWGGPLLQAGMSTGAFVERPIGEVMLGVQACFKGATTLIWAGLDWCPYVVDQAAMVRALTDFILAGLAGGLSPDDAR